MPVSDVEGVELYAGARGLPPEYNQRPQHRVLRHRHHLDAHPRQQLAHKTSPSVVILPVLSEPKEAKDAQRRTSTSNPCAIPGL